MSRICYLHNGLREQCPDCGGCTCVHDWDDYIPSKTIMVSHLPGGSKDTEEYRWHMEFDKDMDSYASAVKEGLEPETVNQSGVKKARNQVKSHQRALKKLGISAQDAKDLGIRLAPGVE